jgi:hypothetical protein
MNILEHLAPTIPDPPDSYAVSGTTVTPVSSGRLRRWLRMIQTKVKKLRKTYFNSLICLPMLDEHTPKFEGLY